MPSKRSEDRGLKSPATPERAELILSRNDAKAAMNAYEQARTTWRERANIVAAMKDRTAEGKAAAVDRLIAAGHTKTDAPKLLHLDRLWSEYLFAVDRAEGLRDEADDTLSISRHRLNLSLLLLASYLPPGVVIPLPLHNGGTAA